MDFGIEETGNEEEDAEIVAQDAVSKKSHEGSERFRRDFVVDAIIRRKGSMFISAMRKGHSQARMEKSVEFLSDDVRNRWAGRSQ